MISEHLRRFNDKALSIKLRDGVCARLFQHHCGSPGKLYDITPNSEARMNFEKVDFYNFLSSIELIKCPVSSGIALFSSTNFRGKYPNLKKKYILLFALQT